MSPIELDRVVDLLKMFALEKGKSLRVTLLGGLALQYYGMENRATVDLDAEVEGDVEGAFHFLKSHQVPSDLGENISGWSVVAMPPGYRERAMTLYRDPYLEIRVLSPQDFVIAKLRRFTEEDIDDALFVVRKYGISAATVRESSEEAVRHSVQDTALFLFRRNVQVFVEKITP
ncbi:MAG: hypothetical protein HY760_03790 [Nitrospirae bacterium]|nr:hypothetical protein [Nitrospirota bacterium]